jgi:hypothetical protein
LRLALLAPRLSCVLPTVQPVWQRGALLSSPLAHAEVFAFCSRFAFSSERCVFVANRKCDVVGSGRVARLRLSFELRLEMALSDLFSLPPKTSFAPQCWRAGLACSPRPRTPKEIALVASGDLRLSRPTRWRAGCCVLRLDPPQCWRAGMVLSPVLTAPKKIAFGAVGDLLFLPSETLGALLLLRARWG